MTTLVTAGGVLIPENRGTPQQVTRSGRPAIARSSSSLNAWSGGGMIRLVGANRTVSYTGLYRTQPSIATVVNKLVRQISRLPLKVYELDSQNSKRRVRDGRLPTLLSQPAPRMGPVHLKQWLSLPTMIHGTGMVAKYRPRPGGPPENLWPLDWNYLQPVCLYQGGPIEYWWTTQFSGERILIDAADVIQVGWCGPHAGGFGVSPLEQLGVTLRIDDALQRHQENNALNAARPSGTIETDLELAEKLDKPTREQLRDDVAALYAGPENAGRPLFLPPGLKWNTIGHSAKDTELIDQRKLAREEVAAVYDVPPPLVGILDHATYSNIAELHRMLYTTTLGPWLTMFEETIKAQLIDGEPAFEGLFVEFDLAEVLKGDTLKEIQALVLAVNSALMTINEARGIRNLPPIGTDIDPDGICDRPLIPTNNVTPVGALLVAETDSVAKALIASGAPAE